MVIVLAKSSSENYRKFTFIIPYAELSSTSYAYQQGSGIYNSAWYCSTAIINVTNTYVQLNAVQRNNAGTALVNYLSTSTITAYYR